MTGLAVITDAMKLHPQWRQRPSGLWYFVTPFNEQPWTADEGAQVTPQPPVVAPAFTDWANHWVWFDYQGATQHFGRPREDVFGLHTRAASRSLRGTGEGIHGFRGEAGAPAGTGDEPGGALLKRLHERYGFSLDPSEREWIAGQPVVGIGLSSLPPIWTMWGPKDGQPLANAEKFVADSKLSPALVYWSFWKGCSAGAGDKIILNFYGSGGMAVVRDTFLLNEAEGTSLWGSVVEDFKTALSNA